MLLLFLKVRAIYRIVLQPCTPIWYAATMVLVDTVLNYRIVSAQDKQQSIHTQHLVDSQRHAEKLAALEMSAKQLKELTVQNDRNVAETSHLVSIIQGSFIETEDAINSFSSFLDSVDNRLKTFLLSKDKGAESFVRLMLASAAQLACSAAQSKLDQQEAWLNAATTRLSSTRLELDGLKKETGKFLCKYRLKSMKQ